MKIRKNIDYIGYAYIFPAVILLGIFIVFSIFQAFRLSLYSWEGIGEKIFIGLENYRRAFSTPLFWHSMGLQFLWVLMSVVLLSLGGLILCFIVELGINKRLIPVLRTIYFMPMMMSLVAIGILWSLIYNPMIGILNELFHFLKLLKPNDVIDFIGDSAHPIIPVFMPAFWQWSGFGMVLFSAALQDIPTEVIEASTIEGCSKMKQIFYIYIPLMKPTIVAVCIINLMGGFKCFDLIWAMTQGGPGYGTTVTTIYIYKEMFVNGNFGYSSTLSVLLFLVTIIFTGIFLKLTTNKDEQ